MKGEHHKTTIYHILFLSKSINYLVYKMKKNLASDQIVLTNSPNLYIEDEFIIEKITSHVPVFKGWNVRIFGILQVN